jgi:hypothetical protein
MPPLLSDITEERPSSAISSNCQGPPRYHGSSCLGANGRCCNSHVEATRAPSGHSVGTRRHTASLGRASKRQGLPVGDIVAVIKQQLRHRVNTAIVTQQKAGDISQSDNIGEAATNIPQSKQRAARKHLRYPPVVHSATKKQDREVRVSGQRGML